MTIAQAQSRSKFFVSLLLLFFSDVLIVVAFVSYCLRILFVKLCISTPQLHAYKFKFKISNLYLVDTLLEHDVFWLNDHKH